MVVDGTAVDIELNWIANHELCYNLFTVFIPLDGAVLQA